MLAYDVFTADPFKAIELKETVGSMVYIPQDLNQMGLFEVEPIVTLEVGLYRTTEGLEFVPTTERGTRRSLPSKDRRKLTTLRTLNLRQEDQINSQEVQSLVAEYMPFDTALDNAEREVEKRQRKLMRKLEFTREYHRFAATAGMTLDADGTLIVNYWEEFGLVKPAPIVFDFATMTEGELRNYVTAMVYRPMMRILRDRKGPNTYLMALCGDAFFDAMQLNPEFRKTYEIQQAGGELRDQKAWTSVAFAGVLWKNFMGTDDGTSIAIATNRCRFIPVGATDVFKEYRSPGEEWKEINTPGEEFYAYVIPDSRAPVYMDHVDLYLDAHPLFACIAPETLLEGVLA